jgi:hypothetical protein
MGSSDEAKAVKTRGKLVRRELDFGFNKFKNPPFRSFAKAYMQ